MGRQASAGAVRPRNSTSYLLWHEINQIKSDPQHEGYSAVRDPKQLTMDHHLSDEPRRSLDLRRLVVVFRFSVLPVVDCGTSVADSAVVASVVLRSAVRRFVSSRFSMRVMSSGGNGSRFAMCLSLMGRMRASGFNGMSRGSQAQSCELCFSRRADESLMHWRTR